MPLQIIRQDITKIKCDVIVCPTDPHYSHGGGTDASIHEAAGEELYRADVVLEVAGASTDKVGGMNTFELAWQCARPNAIVTVVALYDKAQTLPLPDMYGKNLTFKTGGVDGCDCEETLRLIAEGKLDTEPLITHTYPLAKIDEAYELFENKRDGVIKVAVEC